eukprot:1153571-Pelagomonas_calceolata.AAC.2
MPAKRFQKILYSINNCLPPPTDTTGHPGSFVREGGQSSRAGGALGGPGQPGVHFIESRQP